ncbi:hypothetical protein LguiB_005482 [Lonicera macranthoides]
MFHQILDILIPEFDQSQRCAEIQQKSGSGVFFVKRVTSSSVLANEERGLDFGQNTKVVGGNIMKLQ